MKRGILLVAMFVVGPLMGVCNQLFGSPYRTPEPITLTISTVPPDYTPPAPPRELEDGLDLQIDVYVEADKPIEVCFLTSEPSTYIADLNFSSNIRILEVSGSDMCFQEGVSEGWSGIPEGDFYTFPLTVDADSFHVEFGALLNLRYIVHENGKEVISESRSDGASYQRP